MAASQPAPFVERSFASAEWESDQQQLLFEMASELEKRVGDFRVQNATVHVFQRSPETVVVKMVAGPA